MTNKTTKPASVELDLSDVDHRVGKPVGGGQLWEPCSSSDIRRWVMAMVAPQPDPDLGPLTDQVMDALLLANGNTAGSA